MGQVVAAVAVPHTPTFPAMVTREGDDCWTAVRYAALRRQLEAARPDTIVLFDSDHANTFFLDNLPTFAIGVAGHTEGPNDGTPGLPDYRVGLDSAVAAAVHHLGIDSGFDLAVTHEFTVDHSVLVPLHFLTPAMTVPIVPVFINGIIHPIPRAQRAFALGQMVAEAIGALPAEHRVAIVSSGSVSHEVGGPRIRSDAPFGVPDPGWIESVIGHLQGADPQALIAEATTQRLFAAGDVAGELLNMIALLGCTGGAPGPSFLEADMFYGHIFAGWDGATG